MESQLGESEEDAAGVPDEEARRAGDVPRARSFALSGADLAVERDADLLLAESERDSVLWEVSIFLVMAVLWTALAWRVADQPRLARRINTFGERLVPWIMILVGIYILLDTATDTVV